MDCLCEQVNSRLVVKFGDYTRISDCTGVGAPHPCVFKGCSVCSVCWMEGVSMLRTHWSDITPSWEGNAKGRNQGTNWQSPEQLRHGSFQASCSRPTGPAWLPQQHMSWILLRGNIGFKDTKVELPRGDSGIRFHHMEWEFVKETATQKMGDPETPRKQMVGRGRGMLCPLKRWVPLWVSWLQIQAPTDFKWFKHQGLLSVLYSIKGSLCPKGSFLELPGLCPDPGVAQPAAVFKGDWQKQGTSLSTPSKPFRREKTNSKTESSHRVMFSMGGRWLGATVSRQTSQEAEAVGPPRRQTYQGASDPSSSELPGTPRPRAPTYFPSSLITEQHVNSLLQWEPTHIPWAPWRPTAKHSAENQNSPASEMLAGS